MSHQSPGTRFEVIATGRKGTLVAPAKDEHWQVILDGLDDVTEFPLHELRFIT